MDEELFFFKQEGVKQKTGLGGGGGGGLCAK